MEDEDEEEGIEATPKAALAPRNWRNKNGELHRLSGPAVMFGDGDWLWYRHGKIHRDDGPARIWPKHEIEKWYKNGEEYEPSAHELMLWKMKKKE